MKIDHEGFEGFDGLVRWVGGKYGFDSAMVIWELLDKLRATVLLDVNFYPRGAKEAAISEYDGEAHLLTLSLREISREDGERGVALDEARAAVSGLRDAKGVATDGTVFPLFAIGDLEIDMHGRVSCNFAAQPFVFGMYDGWKQ